METQLFQVANVTWCVIHFSKPDFFLAINDSLSIQLASARDYLHIHIRTTRTRHRKPGAQNHNQVISASCP